MFSIAGAQLDLYDYRLMGWDAKRKPVAHAVANASGEFQFDQLKEGHYSLHIKGGVADDWFDVEVTNKVSPTDYINIDVSPTTPDCKGGHQFEIKAVKK